VDWEACEAYMLLTVRKKRKSANKQAFLYSRQGKGKKRRNISTDFKKFEYSIVMAVFLGGREVYHY
jgi:hypothetical protein